MKVFSIAGQKEQLEAALTQALAVRPSLVLFFASPVLMKDAAFMEAMRTRLFGVKVIGCSSAGEIGMQGALTSGFSLLAIRLERTDVQVAHVSIKEHEGSSAKAGEGIAKRLAGNNLKAVFVLGPGTNVNGSAIIEGMTAILGRNVVISGGLAGDDLAFKETFTYCDGQMTNDAIVAFGLYGDAIVVSCGSEGGWRPFGPARRVTRSESNILYELDNKPALQLYKQYLGEKARQLPASGLSYPFAILRGDRTTSGLIRSALDIDHQKEALVLAGDIPQGCQVCLMHADTGALVQGAAQAAAEALRTHAGAEENGFGIIVSCVGRRVILGIDVDDEVEAVTDSFLPGTSIAGYYSYGEICSYAGTGRTELHNQTMTITYITEKTGD